MSEVAKKTCNFEVKATPTFHYGSGQKLDPTPDAHDHGGNKTLKSTNGKLRCSNNEKLDNSQPQQPATIDEERKRSTSLDNQSSTRNILENHGLTAWKVIRKLQSDLSPDSDDATEEMKITRKEKAFHRTWKWAKKGEKLETKSLLHSGCPKRKRKKSDNVNYVMGSYDDEKGRKYDNQRERVYDDRRVINYGNRERTRKKNARQRRKRSNGCSYVCMHSKRNGQSNVKNPKLDFDVDNHYHNFDFVKQDLQPSHGYLTLANLMLQFTREIRQLTESSKVQSIPIVDMAAKNQTQWDSILSFKPSCHRS